RIRIDEVALTRAKVRPAVVRQYAAAMSQQLGLRFPPVALFSEGQDYWLGDGRHRLLAAREAGLSEFPAEIHQGGQRDALLYGTPPNSAPGLRGRQADKRQAVSLLLADAEWSRWSDREIARRCQVGHALVSRMRQGLSVSKRQIAGRKVQRAGSIYE